LTARASTATFTYHEDPVTIKDRTFRQIAVNGLGREQATLILANRQELTTKQLIERYGQRWGIENHLAEQIRAFHLDSLCSQVPLSVDFDVTLTVLADIVYRRFARGLAPRLPQPDPRHDPRPTHQRHLRGWSYECTERMSVSCCRRCSEAPTL
jgi:hypothetical protein